MQSTIKICDDMFHASDMPYWVCIDEWAKIRSVQTVSPVQLPKMFEKSDFWNGPAY